ncbi:uncharacterized protein, partial [Littorina saxatilis]|uniref:uncharacterized protein n=1 Tax=Littorina saxatilis TaxID=31220 RepID=UPI0038B5665F
MLDKRTTARQGSLHVEPGIHMLVCSIEGIPHVVSTLGIRACRGRVALNNCSTSTESVLQGTVSFQRKTMNCTIHVTVAQPVETVGCELDQPQVSSNETYVVDLLVTGAECGLGRYGDYCNVTCGKCAHNDTCDRNTGDCRGCEPGWLPPTCLQRCRAGTFGLMCSKRCGHCLHDANCHHATGFCLKCEPGWNGTTCQNGGRENFT